MTDVRLDPHTILRTRTIMFGVEHTIIGPGQPTGGRTWRHLSEAIPVCEFCAETKKREAQRSMKNHEGTELEKVREQLKAAHETIDELRSEVLDNNVTAAREVLRLTQGIQDVLRFHDECVCRHTRRYLQQALGIDVRRSEAADDLVKHLRDAVKLARERREAKKAPRG